MRRDSAERGYLTDPPPPRSNGYPLPSPSRVGAKIVGPPPPTLASAAAPNVGSRGIPPFLADDCLRPDAPAFGTPDEDHAKRVDTQHRRLWAVVGTEGTGAKVRHGDSLSRRTNVSLLPVRNAAGLAGNRSLRYPCVTQSKNKNGLPEGKPLICLVAGEGFEPSTFGL